MNEGLLRMCRDALIPEPIMLDVGDNGLRFATDALPLRAVIDVRGGFMPLSGIQVDPATITITLDGRTAVYKRRGFDIHGRWICDLVRD